MSTREVVVAMRGYSRRRRWLREGTPAMRQVKAAALQAGWQVAKEDQGRCSIRCANAEVALRWYSGAGARCAVDYAYLHIDGHTVDVIDSHDAGFAELQLAMLRRWFRLHGAAAHKSESPRAVGW